MEYALKTISNTGLNLFSPIALEYLLQSKNIYFFFCYKSIFRNPLDFQTGFPFILVVLSIQKKKTMRPTQKKNSTSSKAHLLQLAVTALCSFMLFVSLVYFTSLIICRNCRLSKDRTMTRIKKKNENVISFKPFS